jgi:hypothetical protein
MASPFFTGLTPRGDHLETTTLSGSRKRVAVVRRPPGEAPGPEGLDWPQALAAVQKELRGELHLALPAASALLHVVDLPTQDRAEIEGMVTLRVEDLTPFPLDRTRASWELIARTETESRVLIALAAHGEIEAPHEAFKAKRLLIHRVDVDVLAWWRLLVHAEVVPAEGAHLAMILDGRQTHLIVFDHGLPVAFRSLGPPDDWTPAILREDLDLVLADLEAERGLAEFRGLAVWHWGAPPACLDGLDTRGHFGFPCQTHNLGSLPPLSEGVALRALESADGGIDLSPAAWKEEERLRALRKQILVGGAAVAAVWLLAMASLLVWVKIREGRVRSLREEARRQEKPVEDVKALAARVRSLSQFTDRSYSALEGLRLIAETMPAVAGRMQLTDCTYRKDSGLTFRGQTGGAGQDFFQLVEDLGASPVLRVEDYDVKRDRGNLEFRVTTKWRWPEAQGDS